MMRSASMLASPSMIVRDLHIVRAVVLPDEAHAPLVVDPDRVLAGPIPLQQLQPVVGRAEEFLERGRGVQHQQLSPHYPLSLLPPDSVDTLQPEALLGGGIPKRLDHPASGNAPRAYLRRPAHPRVYLRLRLT